ncbi:MAG TPA: hypothetical protein VI485_16075 [Vicinamibacterales bacterium]|nr:hypothetical protein [Vicinamibacterales bacterium]
MKDIEVGGIGWMGAVERELDDVPNAAYVFACGMALQVAPVSDGGKLCQLLPFAWSDWWEIQLHRFEVKDFNLA